MNIPVIVTDRTDEELYHVAATGATMESWEAFFELVDRTALKMFAKEYQASDYERIED